MNTRALIPLLPLLAGCVIAGNNNDNAEDDSTSGNGDGDGDGDPSGDGDGDPTGDGDGEPTQMWCGLTEDGPDEPWFSLTQFGATLEQGGDLAVECGFQGFFMIEVSPAIGGFIPESDHVNFQVTLDVEGYNVGPNNHFAASDFNIFVACCDDSYYDYCYYETSSFQMFPPDSIADLSDIHGAPAQLEVTMNATGGPVTQTLDVNMWAMDQDMQWQFCSGYATLPLSVAGLPIPE